MESWEQIARDIQKYYDSFDAFILLHGTDTMSYTASALSFMFSNLTKTVILTGSQIPISVSIKFHFRAAIWKKNDLRFDLETEQWCFG